MISKDLKKRVVEYRLAKHTIEETSKLYKVGTTTVKRWVKEFAESGSLSSKYDVSNRKAKKIEKTELEEFAKTHSDAFLSAYAEHFNCSITAVSKALKRHKITYKKD
jgi:transposase